MKCEKMALLSNNAKRKEEAGYNHNHFLVMWNFKIHFAQFVFIILYKSKVISNAMRAGDGLAVYDGNVKVKDVKGY